MGTRKNFVVPGGLTIDSSTLYVDDPNNRVGVGKTNPDHELDVAGVIRASNGVVTLTSAGTPSATLPDGAIAIDTTNAKLFFRSGSTWNEVTGGGGGGGGGSLTVATTAPSSPSEGDLWFESDTGITFVYYDSYWVEIGPNVVDNLSAQVTTKGDILVGNTTNDLDRLGVGTDSYILTADSSATYGLAWKPPYDIMTAKGDLIAGGGADNAGIVSIGTQDSLLVADTASGQGMKWTLQPQNLLLTKSVCVSLKEKWSVTATVATGTVNLDCANYGAFYFTANASADWTFNLRGSATTSFSDIVSVGESLTVAILVTIGANEYAPTVIQIDGTTQTVKWQTGNAPTIGNANSIDAYLFTAIRTGSSTYLVTGSQTKFA